jgi:hypothetical protein
MANRFTRCAILAKLCIARSRKTVGRRSPSTRSTGQLTNCGSPCSPYAERVGHRDNQQAAQRTLPGGLRDGLRNRNTSMNDFRDGPWEYLLLARSSPSRTGFRGHSRWCRGSEGYRSEYEFMARPSPLATRHTGALLAVGGVESQSSPGFPSYRARREGGLTLRIRMRGSPRHIHPLPRSHTACSR